MNIERFHNELAMRLGFERIVNDKRILISVEESDDPCLILKVQGHNEIRFKASDNPKDVSELSLPEARCDIIIIVNSAHQAYKESIKEPFQCVLDPLQ